MKMPMITVPAPLFGAAVGLAVVALGGHAFNAVWPAETVAVEAECAPGRPEDTAAEDDRETTDEQGAEEGAGEPEPHEL